MKFSIIHASYGRPDMAGETAMSWGRSCSTIHDYEYLMSVDKSDPKLSEYLAKEERGVVINETNTSVAAINNAAKQATCDIIIVISDDFEPIKNWDLEILKVVEGKQDWILKTQDGIQNWIITLPIMDRAYYNRFGYIYNPEYKHMFCDTEITCVADLTGRKIESNLVFKHNHYSVAGERDKTAEKADATWNQGEEVFLRRMKNNFDLIHPPGRITDPTYLNWAKSKR